MTREKQKIYILITVDTEAHWWKYPIEEGILGKFKESYYGIGKIMDICEELEVKATFFVDIAEAWDWGDKKIGKICKKISQRGHDIQLHIHPFHMADPSRNLLWQYSIKEQYNIIRKCKNKFCELCGKPPLAFRAGSYGANNQTLDVLNDLNFKMDFSFFHKRSNCRIKNDKINQPWTYKNLIEIPVTVYQSLKILEWKRYDKIDINSITYNEFRSIFKQFTLSNTSSIIVFFMHSFSFFQKGQNKKISYIRKSCMKKFKKILEEILSYKNTQIITVSDLNEIFEKKNKKIMEYKEFIPSINAIIPNIIRFSKIIFNRIFRN